MSIIFIVLLIIFGISLILLEIVLVPGLIIGLVGCGFLLMAFFWIAQIFSVSTAIITGGITVAVLGIIIWILFKVGVWKKLSLKETIEGRMNEIDTSSVNIGDTGVAVSSLRPMGTVRVNQQKYAAMCDTQMIPPNFPIKVVQIEGDRLIVEPIVN